MSEENISITYGDVQHPGQDVNDQLPDEQNIENQSANTVENVEAGEATEPGGDADHKPEKKDRFQERIKALTDERDRERQAREQAENYLRQQHLQAQQMGLQQQFAKGMPRPSDFNTEAEYQQAYAGWFHQANAAQQQFVAREQAAQQQRRVMQEQAAQVQGKMAAIMSSGAEKYPDFMAALTDPTVPNIPKSSPAAVAAILESDMGAEITYYLAKNPQEITALGNLTPAKAQMRIGAIEARLRRNAPAAAVDNPPSRVRGGSAAVVHHGAEGPKDLDEWMAWRNKQVSG